MIWRAQLLMVVSILGFGCLRAKDDLILNSSVMTVIDKDEGEQISHLVELGMSPNSKLYEPGRIVRPYTLLEYACLVQRKSSIKALVDAGADLRLRSESGEFPIETLIQKNRHDLAAMLALKEQKMTEEATFEHIVCDYLLRTYDSPLNKSRTPVIKINGERPSQTFGLLLHSLFPGTGNIRADKASFIEMKFVLSFKELFGKDIVKFQLSVGGEALNGGLKSTEYRLQYGYWVPEEFKSMER